MACSENNCTGIIINKRQRDLCCDSFMEKRETPKQVSKNSSNMARIPCKIEHYGQETVTEIDLQL